MWFMFMFFDKFNTGHIVSLVLDVAPLSHRENVPTNVRVSTEKSMQSGVLSPML